MSKFFECSGLCELERIETELSEMFSHVELVRWGNGVARFFCA